MSDWNDAESDVVETDVLILGGGLAGLTAGAASDGRTTVLEQLDRPGGLVRTENVEGYWFDRVIHLLYFSHPDVEEFVRGLLGSDLAECAPLAWVETAAGTARFPVQLHLGGLAAEARARCVADLRDAHDRAVAGTSATDYEQVLLDAFGRSLCELFFFPYNRKLWQRPLRDLAADGFHWNLTRPSVAEVLRGADPDRPPTASYNARGWYPRPKSGRRGMEVLSTALANRVDDLRLCHTVESIDPEARLVRARSPQGRTVFRYRRRCVSTLPLPTTVSMCHTAPAALTARCTALPRNRVRSVAVAIAGRRPNAPGHWRYYTRADLPFTRLVFMTEFDTAMAPSSGWGVLAEVVERSEDAGPDDAELIAAVVRGIRDVGLLDGDSVVVATRIFVSDPAYVVFTPESRETTDAAIGFLNSNGIETLGRYGAWTYSSMSQVIESALTWARAGRRPAETAG